MVFSGRVCDLRSHFADNLGRPVPNGVGEADWYIQVINVERREAGNDAVTVVADWEHDDDDHEEESEDIPGKKRKRKNRESRRNMSWFSKFRRPRRASSSEFIATAVVPRVPSSRAEIAAAASEQQRAAAEAAAARVVSRTADGSDTAEGGEVLLQKQASNGRVRTEAAALNLFVSSFATSASGLELATIVAAADGGDDSDGEEGEDEKSSVRFARGYGEQFLALLWRSLVRKARNMAGVPLFLAVIVIYSVVEGSIFVGAGARARELSFQAMFTVASFLVLVVQGQVFVSSALFVSRRFNTKRIREREADDRMYAPALDAVAEAVATIPIVFAVNLISSLTTYEWIGLRGGIGSEPFRRFFFINVLYSYLNLGLNDFWVLLLPSPDTAQLSCMIFNCVTMMFSGLLVPFVDIPQYYRWIYYSNPMAYAWAAMLETEFGGTECQIFVTGSGIPDLVKDFEVCIFFLSAWIAFVRLANCVLQMNLRSSQGR